MVAMWVDPNGRFGVPKCRLSKTRMDDLAWLSDHKTLRKSRIARFKMPFCMVLKVPKSHVNLIIRLVG